MKNFVRRIKEIFNDESGQGTAEYILLLVVVVAVVFLFKGQIKDMVTKKLGELQDGMSSITAQ